MNPISQPVNPFGAKVPQSEAMIKELNDRFREQVIAVFGNPHGLQLLDTLDDLYIRQSTSPPGCAEGYGYWREGQNSLILKLRSIVNSAQR